MSKVLLKFEMDWADEMNVYGFRIMSEDKWVDLEARLRSNEGWDYLTVREYLDDGITTTIISDDVAKTIIDTLGEDYGHFPDLYMFLEELE